MNEVDEAAREEMWSRGREGREDIRQEDVGSRQVDEGGHERKNDWVGVEEEDAARTKRETRPGRKMKMWTEGRGK